MNSDFDNIRNNTDNIVNRVDRQALKNFETSLELNNYRSELLHSLERLDEHSYCPGQVPIDCKSKKNVYSQQEVEKVEKVEKVHGDDCHCSKCCPNPNPNFFQKNKFTIMLSVLWLALIVLAIGWSPSGKTFEAIQESYVELIVNFFKMSIFVIAGFATYYLSKKK